jgi:hypothetical protein
MGPGETIAAVMLGGVVIGVLVLVGESFKRWVAYKQRKIELEAQAFGARQSERGDYVEMLEERVRVLERIATDRGQDIAHQIEKLRDRQAEPQLEARKEA